MIDYSSLPFAKPRPKALDKADKAKALAAKDKAESAKAKKRAGGLCEVYFAEPYGKNLTRWVGMYCTRKDTQTHHLIGGIGRRNKGRSLLADYKLRVCAECHRLITANILQPTTTEHTAATVRYRRVR